MWTGTLLYVIDNPENYLPHLDCYYKRCTCVYVLDISNGSGPNRWNTKIAIRRSDPGSARWPQVEEKSRPVAQTKAKYKTYGGRKEHRKKGGETRSGEVFCRRPLCDSRLQLNSYDAWRDPTFILHHGWMGDISTASQRLTAVTATSLQLNRKM